MATMGQIPPGEVSMSLWEWIKKKLIPTYLVKWVSELYLKLTMKDK